MGRAMTGLCLEPLDVMFFRGGRPFDAAMRAASGLPQPGTLAGALRTALLRHYDCDFDRLARTLSASGQLSEAIEQGCPQAPWIADVAVRGPWLMQEAAMDGASGSLMTPMPAILHQAKRESDGPRPTHRLQPLSHLSLPGWRAPEAGMQPLWPTWPHASEPLTGYLAPEGLQAFLAGGAPSPDQVVAAADLFGLDHRTGIGVHPDLGVSEEGLIYGASFLALRPAYSAPQTHPARPLPKVSIYAELVLPEAGEADAFAQQPVLTFGGEGRRVTARVVAPVASMCSAAKPPCLKPLLMLTTPGLFDAGWRPACLAGRLRAAAVPGYVAVSGWDLARRRPKPTRFAAPAGSVYFLDEALETWPEVLSDQPEDGRQGWGCYVRGVWRDDGSSA